MDYQQLNADTIDKWCRDGWEWSVPITHEAYMKAQQGDWQVYLTPTKPVPRAWLGELRGKRVLGLASAGGQLSEARSDQKIYVDLSEPDNAVVYSQSGENSLLQSLKDLWKSLTE